MGPGRADPPISRTLRVARREVALGEAAQPSRLARAGQSRAYRATNAATRRTGSVTVARLIRSMRSSISAGS